METALAAIYDRQVWGGCICPIPKFVHYPAAGDKFVFADPYFLLDSSSAVGVLLLSDVFKKYFCQIPGK